MPPAGRSATPDSSRNLTALFPQRPNVERLPAASIPTEVRGRMSSKKVVAVLAAVIAVAFAMPAFGAPSPTVLAKRTAHVAQKALRVAKAADRRSRRAVLA